uniref:DUF4220 domain-containing protein n=1 Tax=Oryza glumipatula TaxID=40148 RepID=A0A0E0BLI9_9ORYZ
MRHRYKVIQHVKVEKSMAGAEAVSAAWKEWALQALVLLSLMVQVTLLILAEFRRYIDSGVLRAFIWSAYMLADGTAIYVLGHLSVTSRSPEHELLALWAPFLLLHLGGQDKITAYAIEDNRLWLRHLQTLVVQVAAAAYVIYGSSIVIVGDSRTLLLLSATILMLMVGVAKYGERVWALRCAGSSPTGKYESDIARRRFSQMVPESFIRRLDPAETLLLNAHLLLDFAKDRFKGPLPRLFLCGPMNEGSRLQGEDELYKVAEMQLSLLHDVFYTKSEITHTWYGLCIRVLSSLATTVAFFLFNILLVLGNHHQHKLNGYSRANVIVTYVLFVGAVVLETVSLLRAMFSSWTCALLVKKGSEGSNVCNFLAHIPACLRRLVRAAYWRRRRSWSRSMGQLNLIQLCVHSRASRCSKIARWMGVEDWWNRLAYSGLPIPISACTKQLLLETMKAKQWGQEEFESRGLYRDPAWVAESKMEQRILIWHIATEIYLCWYKDQEKKQAEATSGSGSAAEEEQAAATGGSGSAAEEGQAEAASGSSSTSEEDQAKAVDGSVSAAEGEQGEVANGSSSAAGEEQPEVVHGSGSAADLTETAQALSNYMLFLLASRPHMLPPDASRNDYLVLCYAITRHLRYSTAEDVLHLLQLNADALRTNSSKPKFKLTCTNTNRLGDKMLRGGCSLGAFLIDRQDSPADGTGTLEMICQVWAQMLCCCGEQCSTDSHVKQLSSGGELVTGEEVQQQQQNFVEGYVNTINYVIGEDGMILNAISRQLSNAHMPQECAYRSGMFVLTNVAVGGELNKKAVMNVLVPHRADQQGLTIVSCNLMCVLNLIGPKFEAFSVRELSDFKLLGLDNAEDGFVRAATIELRPLKFADSLRKEKMEIAITSGALPVIWICEPAIMSSSSDQGKKKATAASAAEKEGKKPTTMAGSSSEGKKKKTTATKKKKELMSQAEIDSHIRYQTVEFREEDMVKVGDHMDEYFAKIIRDVNRIESRHMRARDNVLKQYYEKGYVEKDAYQKGYEAAGEDEESICR